MSRCAQLADWTINEFGSGQFANTVSTNRHTPGSRSVSINIAIDSRQIGLVISVWADLAAMPPGATDTRQRSPHALSSAKARKDFRPGDAATGRIPSSGWRIRRREHRRRSEGTPRTAQAAISALSSSGRAQVIADP